MAIGAIDELLRRRPTSRETLDDAGQDRRGASNGITIDGRPVRREAVHAGGDWLMRSSGDFGLRELALWERGVLARLPAEIDHAVVAIARATDCDGVLLMRDVGDVARSRIATTSLPGPARTRSCDEHLAGHARDVMWDWRGRHRAR